MSTRRVTRGGGAPLLAKTAIARALQPEFFAVHTDCMIEAEGGEE